MNPKKKVLVISYYWPPSGGSGVQRWVKFCKYLPEFDIEPIVLTVEDGTYPLIDHTLEKEISEDLKVFKSKGFEPYSLYAKLLNKNKEEVSTPASVFSEDKSLVKKTGIWIRANFFIPDARRGWVNNTFKEAKRILEEHAIDVVITTGPPNSTHLIGTKLKQWRPELKWIMDMRDPWTKIFFNQNIPRTKLASLIDERLEKKALKSADKVAVISNGMEKIQASVFDRKYEVIPNGFDHEDFELYKDLNPNNEGVLSLKYIGSMTEPAIPHALLDSLSKLSEQQREKINIDFFGSINSKFIDLVKKLELDNLITFHGYISHLEAKKEMQTADLLLLVIPNTNDNELIVTGKIYDYIAAQKPILCIGPKDGDAAHIIDEFGLGNTFDYQDNQPLLTFLNNWISLEKTAYKNWDQNFKNHPFSRYSLTKKISSLIKN